MFMSPIENATCFQLKLRSVGLYSLYMQFHVSDIFVDIMQNKITEKKTANYKKGFPYFSAISDGSN